MKRLLSLVFLLCLLTASLGSFAQDTGTGTPAFNSFSHAGGGIDTINLGNLNVHIEIPMRSLGAYGPTASATLVMDSLLTRTNGPQVGSFVLQSSARNLVQNVTSVGDCSSNTATARGVLDWHGTYHDTPLLTTHNCVGGASGPGPDGWSVVSGTDREWYAVAPNGDYSSNATSGIKSIDPHGNTISGAAGFGTYYNGANSGGILTDALGNTVLQGITPTVSAGPVQFTYPGPNSTTSTYTFYFTQENIKAAFGCLGDPTASSSSYLLTGITFPDNSTMAFTYEPVYNDASKVTGRIKSVTLRTGATINYDYTGYGTNGINCSDGSTAGFTKTTPDGVWTFTHSAPNGPGKLTTTTVKAPSGDVTTYLFSGNYVTQVYDAAHINVSTICYNGVRTSCTNRSTPPTLPITERDVYTVAGGMTSSALKVFLYDTYSRLTDVKTYNSGGVIGGTNFVTEETFAYGSWNGSSCSVQNQTVQGVAVPITGLICYNTVWTPGVPNPIIVSDMTRAYYTNTTDVSTESHLIAGVWRPTTIHYDSLGRVLNVTGPNGEYNTVAYGNCPGGLPSQFTSKASGSLTLTQTIDSMDCTGELPLHSLDANNNGTTISYTGDPFWRPTSVTDAAGTVTTLSYTATSKTSRTLVTGSAVKEFVETLDSMGRGHVAQQRQGPSSTQYNSIETDYDSNGRVSRVTTPYPAALGGGNGTIVSTTYAYDAINRPTSIASPNGTVKSFTYTASGSARDTLVGLNSGPNAEHKQTQYEYNGLGQVTSVCEVTSMAGSYGCGQTNPLSGFSTTYSYSGPGKLLSITQNVGGSPTQVRSFTYENSNTGRMLTATTPEAGTFHLTYDTDGTCGTFIGAVVKKADNGGGTTCLSYDLLGRVTAKSYSGLHSGMTPPQKFVYDSTTNANIACPTGSNRLGKLAEVITGGGSTAKGDADEGFCYDVVGNPTDAYYWMNAAVWVHAAETYFPTGIPQTLAVGTQPTITYGLDPMARIYSANASSGQNPLTSVTYNTAGLPTTVNFGSGDSSTYGWKNGIGPMSSAVFNVGTGSATNTLTWNANGTLQKLAITDTLNTADAQTCTYSYDDLSRLLTDNCGSVWSQTFSYDPFGNVTKSGSSSWAPGYDQTNNRYLLAGTTYDANGRLTADTFDSPIAWDVEGNIMIQTGVGFIFDGLGRATGSTPTGGVWTNYIYAPDGSLFATADDSGNIKKMFVPLPMSTAVYNSGTLQQYQRKDWQGSVRVASTPGKTAYSVTGYAASGEAYGTSGSADKQFAGLTSYISSGTEQVSLSRRYHPGQGRWISPDGIIPNILNPQTFNAYHYALNRPTSVTDPSGLTDCPQGKTCNCPIEGCPGLTS